MNSSPRKTNHLLKPGGRLSRPIIIGLISLLLVICANQGWAWLSYCFAVLFFVWVVVFFIFSRASALPAGSVCFSEQWRSVFISLGCFIFILGYMSFRKQMYTYAISQLKDTMDRKTPQELEQWFGGPFPDWGAHFSKGSPAPLRLSNFEINSFRWTFCGTRDQVVSVIVVLRGPILTGITPREKKLVLNFRGYSPSFIGYETAVHGFVLW